MTEPGHSGKKSPQASYLVLFQEVTRMLISSQNVDRVLALIVKKIPDVMGVDAATVRLLDPSGKKLQQPASHGLSREYLDRGPIDEEKCVKAALSGKSVWVYDAATDPCIHYSEHAKKEGVKSMLITPIIIHGKVRGILRLISKSYHHFQDHEISFVKALADQCGIAVENARIHDDNRRQLAYFKTLNEIGKALNSTLRLSDILGLIVDKLPEVMELKGCTIRLVDPANGHLELMAAAGLSKRYLERGSIDEEIGTHQTLGGTPVFIHDAATDPRIRYQEEARKEKIGSILAIPIIVKKRIIGVLRLLTREKRTFTDAEVNFAMAMGEQGGIAINNARSYQKIVDLVTELERHEQFLQDIFDGLKADLFVLDKNHRIVMVNKVFLENHAMEESDVVGEHFGGILRIGDAREKLLRLLKHSERAVRFTRKVTGKSGESHLEVSATPVFRHGRPDKIDFIIGTIRDVSDHILLKKEQRERERLQGVVEMSGAVAHELNNPLAVVSASVQLLKKEIAAEGPAAEDMEIITRNLKRIAGLISRMTRITEYKSKRYLSGVNIIDIEGACGLPDTPST